jgi:exopolysaccharide biosynthesis polyprenyl glycosylphosphotransferase
MPDGPIANAPMGTVVDSLSMAVGHTARPIGASSGVHRVADRLRAKGFRFLFVLDAVGLYATMVVINLVRFGFSWPTYPLSHYVVGFTIATAIHLAIGYLAGMYEREPRIGHRPWLPQAMLAMAIGVATEGIAVVVLNRYLMPRLNLVALFVVGSLVLTGNRRLSRRLAIGRQGPSRLALVGAADAVALARQHLGVPAEVLVAYLDGIRPDARPERQGGRDEVVVCEAATTANLAELVLEHNATDVLLLDVQAFSEVFPEPLTALEALGVGFHQRVGAHETLLGLRSVREIAGMPFVRLRTHTMAVHQHRLKRGLDLLVLLIGAPLAIPTLLVLMVYVRIRAGSPVFYRQVRRGRDGVPFDLLKFRTMVRDAEQAGGAVLSSADDPRVIRGLRWMRSTRFDELPQLWNVLRGQMSLVGPRPERPEFADDLAALVPGYGRRDELRPGLTGLAQVHGRYDTDAAYKVGYDLQYLVNWSPVLDLQIMVRTIWVVVARRV